MGSCSCIPKKEIDIGNIENSLVIKIREHSSKILNKNSFSSYNDIINYEINKNKNTTERELLSLEQQRADSIFDYFNQIKVNPQNFLEESKAYDLFEELNEYINSNERPLFIKNRFYNSLLELYAKKTPSNDKQIERSINNDLNMNKYEKNFYVVESTLQEPNNSVWILLQKNKKNILNKMLMVNISYLILYISPIENTTNIKVYFLFLQLKNT